MTRRTTHHSVAHRRAALRSLPISVNVAAPSFLRTPMTTRFRCPTCNFAIFNRRLATCEACGASLPDELLFSSAHLALLDAEHAKNERLRKDMANEADEAERQRVKRRGDGG